MAGHSKWANIKFRKGVQDAKRGKIFTKLIREITVAARMGGGDESSNPRLRDAVKKALNANMKRDTIDNAVKRGVGGADGEAMIAMRYEGYGPGGVAILVDCLSDNKNRTVSEVRHAFSKHGGNLGTDGSVSYLFTNQGEILMASNQPEDKVMEIAIDAGASDVAVEDSQIEIITPVEAYHTVLNALQDAALEVEQSHLTMRAQTLVPISDETAESLIKLIDMLEDLDDVQEVYSNAEFSEKILESMN
ncbi:TPA: YebC/PmpR family DNA-binding transcriptional regulator [Legionella pneumophila subsp. pneumophila]|uniref:Probable transcriptional regulatory protein lpl1249 n=1 Tax=Legionella pneumophila (strain Lens) TaxID=297245 RepID=Y1249_LEGPL|nr:YebC/PmpR family DNA-binding transcriptional regulator [Legionella pneumophila]Q5WX49.1 RecName: Full=Probable transcriptional regulatory protein lpl1249 [Legionella pneumophila str. Lens]AOW52155.1 transcriptional regulator [Legionella pneumophila subsp. pneumophila]AOW54256.1 transcriptional regulator [Legionella pneumophila subsp. pneumophila]AOW62950.1 transcriptional regulator [Legionella pneumophila subsp. pneumophila]RYW83713.1 YebC/PmpR family DNA-binding transcriptional regulator [